MRTVDILLVCVVVALVLAMSAVLARQRQMLRATGTVPLAILRGDNWVYGVGRYTGPELRWFRGLGVGTRPSRVLRQGQVEVLNRRAPRPDEGRSLPPRAVVVDCRVDGATVTLAIGESAYTGFVSWLESSAPRA